MSIFSGLRAGDAVSGRMSVLCLCAGLLASASLVSAPAFAAKPASDDFRSAKTFACGAAGKMQVAFASRSGELQAVVQWPGQPRRALRILPPDGVARIAWTDGVRSLTWEPGVLLTWREGPAAQAVSCSLDRGHDHGEAQVAAPQHMHDAGRTI